MTARPWAWESDEEARRALLIASLAALEQRGPEMLPRSQVAAVVDWGLRERYRGDRYRRAYRALKKRISAKGNET